MAKSVARGKALVAKFRADPSVRDPEALAAYAGRKKALRKATKGKLKHKKKVPHKKYEGRSRGSEDLQQHKMGDAVRGRAEDARIAKKRANALAAISSDAEIKRQVEEQAKRLKMPVAVKQRILRKRILEAAKKRAAAKKLF